MSKPCGLMYNAVNKHVFISTLGFEKYIITERRFYMCTDDTRFAHSCRVRNMHALVTSTHAMIRAFIYAQAIVLKELEKHE